MAIKPKTLIRHRDALSTPNKTEVQLTQFLIGQKKGHRGRWRESACLLLIVWGLGACTQVPHSTPQVASELGRGDVATTAPAETTKKVQTLEELMRKLKQGWDERRLDDPNFYAKELGYPVERPETFNVYGAKDSYRVIRFDEGELTRMRVEVHPMVLRDGRRALVVSSIIGAILPSCVKKEVLFDIWTPKRPAMPEAWGAHGVPMNWRYDYSGDSRGKSSIFVDKQSDCLSEFEFSQYSEQ